MVACGDYETAAMIDRLVNTETWAIDEGLKRVSEQKSPAIPKDWSELNYYTLVK